MARPNMMEEPRIPNIGLKQVCINKKMRINWKTVARLRGLPGRDSLPSTQARFSVRRDLPIVYLVGTGRWQRWPEKAVKLTSVNVPKGYLDVVLV